MEYKKNGFITLLFCLFFMSSSKDANATTLGPLKKYGNTDKEVLSMFGTVPANTVAELINKYGPYGDSKKEAADDSVANNDFSFLTQERAQLLEAFFVHFGLMSGAKPIAAIDGTADVSFDVGLVLNKGLALDQVVKDTKVTTLPKACGKFFNASRYMRGFGATKNKSVKGLQTDPVDTFYGVVVVNVAWFGAPQKIAFKNYDELEKSGDAEQKGDGAEKTYWIKAGVNVSSFQKNSVFIKSQSAGVARVAGGIDEWDALHDERVLSFVMTDKDGASPLSSTKQAQQVSVSQSATPNVPQIKLNGKIVPNTLEMTNFFKTVTSAPWALLVEVGNPSVGGNATLEPTVMIKGLLRLNPLEFPFSYSGAADTFGQPIATSSILFSGFDAFVKTVSLSPAISTNTVGPVIKYGDCSDVQLSNKMSLGSQDGAHMERLNTTRAKLQGALNYKWGAEYSIEQALQGMNTVGRKLALTKDAMQPIALYEQILGKHKDKSGQKTAVKQNSNILIFGGQALPKVESKKEDDVSPEAAPKKEAIKTDKSAESSKE